MHGHGQSHEWVWEIVLLRTSHLFFTTDFPSAPFSLPLATHPFSLPLATHPFSLPLATHPFSLPLATHPFCNVTTLRVYLVGVATVGRLCHGLHIFIAANRTPEREPLSNRFRWYLTSWRPMGCSVDVWWAREGELGGIGERTLVCCLASVCGHLHP